MKILNQEYPWMTAIISNRKVEAKVFNEGSHFGIRGGDRISKLCIRDMNGKVEFDYDRGHDVNRIDKKVLSEIIQTLQNIPTTDLG